MYTAASLDPEYSHMAADGHASIYMTKGLRYTVYVEESTPRPSGLTLTGTGWTTPVRLDAERHGDKARLSEAGKTYAWHGAFTAPGDGLVSVAADPLAGPQRVQVDAPGFGMSVAFVLAAPLVVIICGVWGFLTYRGRRRPQGYWTRRPSSPFLEVARAKRAERARAALAEHWTDGVVLANGTLVPGASEEEARERLADLARPLVPDARASVPDARVSVADARIRGAGDGGRLVDFPAHGVAVFVDVKDAKSGDDADVMRCAVARLELDVRNREFARA
ncbi:hypothetical protein [Actinomadura harenae]|uniref:Uncharacterized protein n=1 Tax=Actinomadura harenae TaxID=2483351 RepID=A0A3M2LXU6_9ACTN|nr:hypothetical protein [Actinomadura harenae]RMI42219.1 hypothetical protein EBO15_20590 [Actinomadura harenae]